MGQESFEANVIAAREEVERCKKVVRDLNLEMQLAKGRSTTTWRQMAARKEDFNRACSALKDAKIKLVKLSGTTGHDQRWILVTRSYAVLCKLDEAGVDIGEIGRKLIEDIEFHVPLSKLEAAIQEHEAMAVAERRAT